uniref:C2 NT-type domain-containing protein n=1 Tax=Fagus sylvatica TaxID=28930 RepID=A0A2N9EWA8_FAGSY
MAAEYSSRRNSNTQLLDELEALSQSLYQSHTSTNRRTASLALPRSSVPSIPSADEIGIAKVEESQPNSKSRRRMSLSPWRSRPKLDDENDHKDTPKIANQPEIKRLDERATSSSAEKKGIWKWKPIRALSHIGMHKLSCLFSVEVVTAQGLPASMNGLRLSVCVRKKETKDGAVHTMPSRVSQGAADFEETLFVRCHVYSSSGNGKHLKFEPRPFWIYVFAVDAAELDFGRSSVDLSQLIEESVERSFEGTRVRQWDTSFNLSGKAKGGELVLKLGFQIMEKDGEIGIYKQAEELRSDKSKILSSSFARKQSKTSFSVPSPRMSSRKDAWSPSQTGGTRDLHGIDELNLDEPAPAPAPAPAPSSSLSIPKAEEPETKMEDLDLPEFDVVDKGVEVQEKEEDAEGQSEKSLDERSVSSEVVKEIVPDQVHLIRLTELDSIAKQIKALESMMGEGKIIKMEEETESPRLDADEENVTREFLQLLEEEETNGYKLNQPEIPPLQFEGTEDSTDSESKVYLPDLGKGLGCVVQTRNGGYLAAMNPLDTEVARKDVPKLAMQISKPFVLASHQSISSLRRHCFCNNPREKQRSCYLKCCSYNCCSVKLMATAMSTGRKERISTGIWNVNEDPLTAEEVLAFSMQKIEAMAIEALKIQAEMVEEEAPFDVSPLNSKTGGGGGNDQSHPLASAVSLEDWIKNYSLATSESEPGDPADITIAMVIQLRDPIRRYEAVGGPVIVLVHATGTNIQVDKYDDEKRFKLTSLHVGGLKIRTSGKRNVWDTEKQRLTAMQWLVAFGLGKAGKKGKHAPARGQDLFWSISSRVMADMWLKPMRNLDVRFAN